MDIKERVRFWLGEYSSVFTDDEIDEFIEESADLITGEVNARRAAALGFLRLAGSESSRLTGIQLGDARQTYSPDYFLRYASWLYSGASHATKRRDEMDGEDDELD